MKYRTLLNLSKGLLKKEHHEKIISLKNKEEKINLLKYLLISQIKLLYLELELLLNNSSLKEKKEDFEILLIKSSTIPSKISILEVDFNEKDFKKILSLIENIKLRL